MSIWDDPELANDSEYVNFDNAGDKIAGTIQAIRKHTWADGTVCPKINLVTDDGEEKTVTAGQVKLKQILADKRPESGDHIVIVMTEIEKRAGGKTMKHFDVTVTPGSGKPTMATPAAPTSPPAAPTAVPAQIDPNAAAAALANLTPEQRAALGITAA